MSKMFSVVTLDASHSLMTEHFVPARFFPELRALREDHGGSTVIRRHEDALLLYDVPARQLADVDTRAALDALTVQER